MNTQTDPSSPSREAPLAIFDLDNTLLAGDSDYLWGQFLVERGIVDGPGYQRENRRYYEQYKAGELDIYDFLRFSLTPLTQHDPQKLAGWRAEFVQEKIRPIVATHSAALIQTHRDAGHVPLILTATNRFVTEPIADMLGIETLLATDPEIRDGRYTGEIAGIPCFQDGKIKRLHLWLEEQGRQPGCCWFYSDSHNDLPLLREVDYPVAVDPDPQLEGTARTHGWPVVSLRGEEFPEVLRDSLS